MLFFFIILNIYSLSPSIGNIAQKILNQTRVQMTEDEGFLWELIHNSSINEEKAVDQILDRIEKEGLSLSILIMIINRMQKQEDLEISLEEALNKAFIQLQREYRQEGTEQKYQEEKALIDMELKSLVFQTGEAQALLEVVSNAYDATCENREEVDSLGSSKKIRIHLDSNQNRISIQDQGLGLDLLGFLTLLFRPHHSGKTKEIHTKVKNKCSIGFMGQGAFAALMLTQEPYNGELRYTSIEGQILLKKEREEIIVQLNTQKYLEEGLLFEVQSAYLDPVKLGYIESYFQEKLKWQDSENCEIVLKTSSKKQDVVLNQGLLNQYELALETDKFRIWITDALSTSDFSVNIISQGVSLVSDQRYNCVTGQSYRGIVIDLKGREWIGMDRSSWNWGQENSLKLFEFILESWNERWFELYSNKKQLMGLYIIFQDIFSSLSSSYLAKNKDLESQQSIYFKIKMRLELMKIKCVEYNISKDVSFVSFDPHRPILFHGYSKEKITEHMLHLKEPSVFKTNKSKSETLFPSTVSSLSEQSFLLGFMYAKLEDKRIDIPFGDLLENLVKKQEKRKFLATKEQGLKTGGLETQEEGLGVSRLETQEEGLGVSRLETREEKITENDFKNKSETTLMNCFVDDKSVLKVNNNAKQEEVNSLQEKLPHVCDFFEEVRKVSGGYLGNFNRHNCGFGFMVKSTYEDYIKETEDKYKEEVRSFEKEAFSQMGLIHKETSKQENEEIRESYIYFYLVVKYLKSHPLIFKTVMESCCFPFLIQDELYKVANRSEKIWFLNTTESTLSCMGDYIEDSKGFWVILYGFIRNEDSNSMRKEHLIYLSLLSNNSPSECDFYEQVLDGEPSSSRVTFSKELIKKIPIEGALKIDYGVHKKREEFKKKHQKKSKRYQEVVFYFKFLNINETLLESLEEEDIEWVIKFKLSYEYQIARACVLRKIVSRFSSVEKKWRSLSYESQVNMLKGILCEVLERWLEEGNDSVILLHMEFLEYINKEENITNLSTILEKINLYENYQKGMNKKQYFKETLIRLRLLSKIERMTSLKFIEKSQFYDYIVKLPVNTEEDQKYIEKISEVVTHVIRRVEPIRFYEACANKELYISELFKRVSGHYAFFMIRLIHEIRGETFSYLVSKENSFLAILNRDFENKEHCVYPSKEMKQKNKFQYTLELKKIKKLVHNKDATIIRMVREIFNNEFEAGSSCMDVHLVEATTKEGNQSFIIFSGKGSGIDDLRKMIEPGRSGHSRLSDNLGTGTLSILAQCPTYYVKTCYQGVLKEARVRQSKEGMCSVDQIESKQRESSFTQICLPLKKSQVPLIVNAIFEVAQGFYKKEIYFHIGDQIRIPIQAEQRETQEVKGFLSKERLEVDFYLTTSPVSFYREGVYMREFMGSHEYSKDIPFEVFKVVNQEFLGLHEKKTMITVGKEWRETTTRMDILPNLNQRQLLESVFELLLAKQFIHKAKKLGLNKKNYRSKDVSGLLEGYFDEAEGKEAGFYKGVWNRIKTQDYTRALEQMNIAKRELEKRGSYWNYKRFIRFSPAIQKRFNQIKTNEISFKNCKMESTFLEMLEREFSDMTAPTLKSIGFMQEKEIEEVGLTKEELGEYQKMFNRLEGVLNQLSFIKDKEFKIVQCFYIGNDTERFVRINKKEGSIQIDINLHFLKKYIDERAFIFSAIIGYLFYHIEGGKEGFLELQEKYQELFQSALESSQNNHTLEDKKQEAECFGSLDNLALFQRRGSMIESKRIALEKSV